MLLLGMKTVLLAHPLPSASDESEEGKRYLVVNRVGQYGINEDVTFWQEGDYVHIHDFFIQWNGQDSIDYWIQDGILYVDSLPRGINLNKASIQDIENPELVVSAHTDPHNIVFLNQFPELESASFFNLDEELDLSYLTSMKKLKVLWLNSTDLEDSQLAHLAGLKELRELEFYDNEQITDKGLRYLKDLRNLAKLGLGYTGVTDSGLACLEGLENLRELDISTTRTCDAGLVYLRDLTRLEVLNLWGVAVSDSGLALIAHLTRLRELTLNGTLVTDAGLSHLGDLSSIRELNLEYTAIKGPGLSSLEGLKNLTVLDLRGSPVTGKAVPHLARLKNLKLLDLADTRLKPRDVKKIKQALPDCEIVYFIRPQK